MIPEHRSTDFLGKICNTNAMKVPLKLISETKKV